HERRTTMTTNKTIVCAVALALAITGAGAAQAQLPPLIDDFTAGPYRVQLDHADTNDRNVQRDATGQHILGGKRYTYFNTGTDTFDQSAILETVPNGNAVLAFSAGVRTYSSLQIHYGLDLDLLGQNVVTPLHL